MLVSILDFFFNIVLPSTINLEEVNITKQKPSDTEYANISKKRDCEIVMVP